jgi:SWIM zinc finger
MARRRRRASFALYSRFAHLAGFAPYVSVGARRAKAVHEQRALAKKGRELSPVVIVGRKITATFWGDAWCDNLERYSDFANRLPRGRSYLRNGLVLDLQIAPGAVKALVSGSRVYTVTVALDRLAPARWKALCADCSGAIDSLVELLQGRLSHAVMTRLCDPRTGLFPSPQEIAFTCSCPDGAWMCKHVAAVLYGVGARLDHAPDLFFTLRQVNHQDLVAGAGTRLAAGRGRPRPDKVLQDDDLSVLFGIDIADEPKAPRRPKPRRTATPKPKKT